MSNRLDKERERKLQPERMKFALNELEALGYEVKHNDTRIDFVHNGSIVQFFPYSGWHTGKTIIDGRGIKKLLRQL